MLFSIRRQSYTALRKVFNAKVATDPVLREKLEKWTEEWTENLVELRTWRTDMVFAFEYCEAEMAAFSQDHWTDGHIVAGWAQVAWIDYQMSKIQLMLDEKGIRKRKKDEEKEIGGMPPPPPPPSSEQLTCLC